MTLNSNFSIIYHEVPKIFKVVIQMDQEKTIEKVSFEEPEIFKEGNLEELTGGMSGRIPDGFHGGRGF